MNHNDTIIPKDRKNKILKFTGIEDWNEMLTDFKECMSTNNHGGVLADNDYEEPKVQTVALARLRGIGGGAPLPTDERDKCDVTT